jgi:hypothetical protein
MPKSCDKKCAADPLLRVECVTERDGRIRTYTITVGSSAIAIVLILVGSRVYPFQDILHAVIKFAVPH